MSIHAGENTGIRKLAELVPHPALGDARLPALLQQRLRLSRQSTQNNEHDGALLQLVGGPHEQHPDGIAKLPLRYRRAMAAAADTIMQLEHELVTPGMIMSLALAGDELGRKTYTQDAYRKIKAAEARGDRTHEKLYPGITKAATSAIFDEMPFKETYAQVHELTSRVSDRGQTINMEMGAPEAHTPLGTDYDWLFDAEAKKPGTV